MAVAALVLGIVGVIPAIVGIVFSMISLKEVNNGFGIAGLVCACGGLILGGLATVLAFTVILS
ncbi:MAG: hypothetical protein K6G06_08990 [Butyrivibrio sp.]|nr:hypothetical protein [Butyrivibrio sp.]